MNFIKNYQLINMENVALITALFDYPDYYEPTFYKNALKYFLP
jgi:hypothetical protein